MTLVNFGNIFFKSIYNNTQRNVLQNGVDKYIKGAKIGMSFVRFHSLLTTLSYLLINKVVWHAYIKKTLLVNVR